MGREWLSLLLKIRAGQIILYFSDIESGRNYFCVYTMISFKFSAFGLYINLKFKLRGKKKVILLGFF